MYLNNTTNILLLKMENMGTDVPKDFSKQMCEIATTAVTPEASMKNLFLLKTVRVLKVKAPIAEVKHLTISL